jgi:hypothetical protein
MEMRGTCSWVLQLDHSTWDGPLASCGVSVLHGHHGRGSGHVHGDGGGDLHLLHLIISITERNLPISWCEVTYCLCYRRNTRIFLKLLYASNVQESRVSTGRLDTRVR